MTNEAEVRNSTVQESAITAESFDFFKHLVNDRIGVQLEGKAYLADSRLKALVRKHDLDDANELIERIRHGDRALSDAAIEAMTTNETSFFRDVHPFEALATAVLPSMFEQKRIGKLRIWNGACASGQESYSLAMILHEHFPERAKPANVQILSTDVSPAMVKRVADGSYSRFEVNRGLPADYGQKYFDQTGRTWVAKPELRDLIKVDVLNLLDSWTAIPRCEVVILRNVLIYFAADIKKEILRRIRRDVLQPGGCLVLGASESTIGTDNNYESRTVSETTLFFPRESTDDR